MGVILERLVVAAPRVEAKTSASDITAIINKKIRSIVTKPAVIYRNLNTIDLASQHRLCCFSVLRNSTMYILIHSASSIAMA